MAKCVTCQSETELHVNGVPLCPKCADVLESKNVPAADPDFAIRQRLEEDERYARQLYLARLEEFQRIIADVPSGTPHPDGSLRIRNASAQVRHSRQRYDEAHRRRMDFLVHGVVPTLDDPRPS